jgi:hypothetical protein
VDSRGLENVELGKIKFFKFSLRSLMIDLKSKLDCYNKGSYLKLKIILSD